MNELKYSILLFETELNKQMSFPDTLTLIVVYSTLYLAFTCLIEIGIMLIIILQINCLITCIQLQLL